jgi:TRAP-type C4-dicarboxylate transport system permease large subunit
MTKHKGIIFSILLVVVGYISLYLAWGILLGPTFSTIAMLLGIGLIIFGIVMFIISAKKD